MTKLLLQIIFAASFLVYEYSTGSPPTQLLADILSYFKTAELCDHVTEVFIWKDDSNMWDIRFKAILAEGENGEQLCNCMYEYINQKNWLGAKCNHVCIYGPNCVTLVLEGPASTDQPVIKPIDTLCSVLKNFENAQLGDHACTSKCKKEGSKTRLELKCALTCDSPSPTVARDLVLNYLNQNGLLTSANVTANSDGQFVDIIIIGD